MKAILFGSIGVIVETSELQRASFNEAFIQHHLRWKWEQDQYSRMLKQSGGTNRIRTFAETQGIDVDADAIHQTKCEVFQKKLRESSLSARPGVLETIADARCYGLKIGLITTTLQSNVNQICDAVGLDATDFDVICDRSFVEKPKPSADCYNRAMDELNLGPSDCIAIEDNVDGVIAAQTAGILCLSFPGSNTEMHCFPEDTITVPKLSYEILVSHAKPSIS